MAEGGTIARTCAVVESLMRGTVHDRHTIAYAFDVGLAAADRYIKCLSAIPGIRIAKVNRRKTIGFLYSEAIRIGIGR